ncbi:hypothetical protein RJT34_32681 [Clitoria ternatea]|uniref:Uncharacterized protein n=1 Tax=Clitoria ternatea TaxID=43366 RepID=A0AAN9F0R4_CLITE
MYTVILLLAKRYIEKKRIFIFVLRTLPIRLLNLYSQVEVSIGGWRRGSLSFRLLLLLVFSLPFPSGMASCSAESPLAKSSLN